MNYTKESFESNLSTFTFDEQIYRDAYFHRIQEPDTYQEYLASLDKEMLRQRMIMIPELFDIPQNPTLQEDVLFFQIPGEIKLAKHNRYSPVFTHFHDYYEILYIYKGTGKNCVQNNEYTLHPGDLCIIPPQTYHSVSINDDETIAINIMIRTHVFTGTFFSSFPEGNALSHFFSHVLNDNIGGNYVLFHCGNDDAIRNLVEDMYLEYMNREKYYNACLNNLLMYFWCILLRNHEDHITSYLSEKCGAFPIAEITEYISKNYATVTLSEAADHFAFNHSYFSTMIKEMTGRSFSKIVKDMKMQKACQALEHTNLTIDAICDLVGYANKEHFMRTFKTEFQIPPGEYRKNKQHHLS